MSVYGNERPFLHHANRLCGTIIAATLVLLTFGMQSASAQSDANKDAQRIYIDQGCAVCHGLIGRGGVGPDFVGDHFLIIGDYVAAQIEAAGATYFVCDFAFGTITHDEAMRSVELFAAEVMPALA